MKRIWDGIRIAAVLLILIPIQIVVMVVIAHVLFF